MRQCIVSGIDIYVEFLSCDYQILFKSVLFVSKIDLIFQMPFC